MVRGYNLRDMFIFNMNGLAPSAMMSGMIGLSAAYYPGSNVLWSLIISTPFVLAFALSYAALAGAMPRSGGDYVFGSRIIHPIAGLISGLVYNVPVHIIADTGLPFYFFTYVLPMTLVLSFPGNAAVAGFVSTMSNPAMIIAFGTIVIWAAVFTAVFGAKVWKTVMTIICIFGLTSCVLIIGLLASLNNASFIQAFNVFAGNYGTSYDAIISSATKNGWSPTPDNLFMSLAPITYLFLFIFTAWPIYLASEVKSAEKAVPISIISSILTAQAIAIIIAALYEVAVPKNFMSALSYLAYKAPSGSYPLPWNPEIITLLAATFPNTITTLLIGFGITLFNLSFIFGDVVLVSRQFFYWSFDRLIPKKFASVNARWKTPAFSLIFYGCIIQVVMFIAVYTNILALLSNLSLLLIVGFTPSMVAAAALAYTKKGIWEKAPGWIQRKIGSIPIVTIYGSVAAVFQVIMAVLLAAYFPIFGGPVTPASIAFILFWVFVTIPWYYYARYYHLKKEGIDIAWAFKQVPPA
jgi:amino acid transporter